MEENKPKIGELLRGQGWVTLHGDFTIEQLKSLIKQLKENCKGLERKNGN